MSILCGIDGCKKGWLVLTFDTDTLIIESQVMATAELAQHKFDLAGIDIPIGLVANGARECDLLARRHLGKPRSNSVFTAPIRSALEAKSWPEACDIRKEIEGKKISKQAYGIFPKISQIDSLLISNPGLSNRLFEVHPEISFSAWSGRPMSWGKKKSAGQIERQALICQKFGENAFQGHRNRLWGSGVSVDDLSDAFSALWTAQRRYAGTALRLPQYDAYDGHHLPMNIWY